ncbi:MAG: chloride channel protein [Ekhidna sp.]|nr:chloride channel protein [Ekhidna sp.]MBC6410224.1 chloride channel protein [Ekhidna sp.]MBC6426772.1 chloride channel protein [Ekhidna sp.]
MAQKSSKTGRLIVKFLVWRMKNISDNNFLLIIAGLIGVFSGLAAVILKSAVHELMKYLEISLNLFGFNYLYLVYPFIGIILTVIISKYLFREKLGHGITQILYAISKNSSIIRKTGMYSRMVTSAITVGFGGSVGLEAPIVVTGSAIGSNLARLFHLSYKQRTLLLGCGAAGAISAIFNSPVTGVIFAMEVILTEVVISRFIPLLLASVCGQLVSLVLLGDDILFSFKLTDSFQAKETGYYLVFAAICGIVSLYFTRMMYLFEGSIQKIKNDFVRTCIGGISLALIILTFPPLYGEGYTTIKSLLNGTTEEIFLHGFFYWFSDDTISVILFIVLILLVKPIAAAFTIGAGGSGGIFAPSLFMGGLTGYAFSATANTLFGSTLSTSNFTLVGMCGVMSGVLHAPLTAIFLIAEITSGYVLFVPLMLVSAISFSTISYFEKHSIYTKGLIEAGDFIPYDKDRIVLSLIDLKKIIEKDLLVIDPDATLEDLVKLVKKSKRNIFPVVNDRRELKGIVTLDDIREMMFDTDTGKAITIRTIMNQPPASVSTQEKMQSVMSKFEVTQAWNLPVIDDGKYVGFISKSRIFNAYRNKLIRQTAE